ncbi:hypothetical protein KFL_000980190 [Klebsormidium nitens]|uniref:Uncharacterized protein n=1 Tax=Klebsormidium nitens TaxID=105231 RepID=A0A0U9HL96_KLENI|nr:hypothetical protein KFL_000980190 [Klebsormidium nitens]|eukprot:GAQ82032.1 hypothetical protein KFL_000980190 [Klebsormidium nitens]
MCTSSIGGASPCSGLISGSNLLTRQFLLADARPASVTVNRLGRAEVAATRAATNLAGPAVWLAPAIGAAGAAMPGAIAAGLAATLPAALAAALPPAITAAAPGVMGPVVIAAVAAAMPPAVGAAIPPAVAAAMPPAVAAAVGPAVAAAVGPAVAAAVGPAVAAAVLNLENLIRSRANRAAFNGPPNSPLDPLHRFNGAPSLPPPGQFPATIDTFAQWAATGPARANNNASIDSNLNFYAIVDPLTGITFPGMSALAAGAVGDNELARKHDLLRRHIIGL